MPNNTYTHAAHKFMVQHRRSFYTAPSLFIQKLMFFFYTQHSKKKTQHSQYRMNQQAEDENKD
jgi:hypothetical protein